ncbi:MAG: SRPBCC family protein [Cytophagales bacterium]|nr:SRPBCC family protein [Cytophagales bacterium]
MRIHQLTVRQNLPISLEEAWDFFSSPDNLNLITPEDMSFQIVSGVDKKTYAGQIISYKIKPVFNIPMNWVTEITHCVNHKYFIDEQRFGPYRFWHHQHHFKETESGILMKDILHYALPFGIFGELLGKLMIHEKVKNIFNYREQRLYEIFGSSRGH